ncbi:hypothetical protein ABPG72_005358 [Tetrahymena utriculariae]
MSKKTLKENAQQKGNTTKIVTPAEINESAINLVGSWPNSKCCAYYQKKGFQNYYSNIEINKVFVSQKFERSGYDSNRKFNAVYFQMQILPTQDSIIFNKTQKKQAIKCFRELVFGYFVAFSQDVLGKSDCTLWVGRSHTAFLKRYYEQDHGFNASKTLAMTSKFASNKGIQTIVQNLKELNCQVMISEKVLSRSNCQEFHNLTKSNSGVEQNEKCNDYVMQAVRLLEKDAKPFQEMRYLRGLNTLNQVFIVVVGSKKPYFSMKDIIFDNANNVTKRFLGEEGHTHTITDPSMIPEEITTSQLFSLYQNQLIPGWELTEEEFVNIVQQKTSVEDTLVSQPPYWRFLISVTKYLKEVKGIAFSEELQNFDKHLNESACSKYIRELLSHEGKIDKDKFSAILQNIETFYNKATHAFLQSLEILKFLTMIMLEQFASICQDFNEKDIVYDIYSQKFVNKNGDHLLVYDSSRCIDLRCHKNLVNFLCTVIFANDYENIQQESLSQSDIKMKNLKSYRSCLEDEQIISELFSYMKQTIDTYQIFVALQQQDDDDDDDDVS